MAQNVLKTHLWRCSFELLISYIAATFYQFIRSFLYWLLVTNLLFIKALGAIVKNHSFQFLFIALNREWKSVFGDEKVRGKIMVVLTQKLKFAYQIFRRKIRPKFHVSGPFLPIFWSKVLDLLSKNLNVLSF